MVKVVVTIIIDDNKVFAIQRGHDDFKDGWEFSSGKVETNETPEDALKKKNIKEL